MSAPPEELMTREKIFFRERHQNSPTYGHLTKQFFELAHKGNKQMKTGLICQQTLAVFSAGMDSENKIIQMLHRNGQK